MRQGAWEAGTKAFHLRRVCFLSLVLASCGRTEHASPVCSSGMQGCRNHIASLCFSTLQGKVVNSRIWSLTILSSNSTLKEKQTILSLISFFFFFPILHFSKDLRTVFQKYHWSSEYFVLFLQ